MRKPVARLEADGLRTGATDCQCFENFFAARHANQTLLPRPLACPIYTGIASLKRNSALVSEMQAHGFETRQNIRIIQQTLESVSGHHDQVEAPLRPVVLRRCLD